MKLYLITETDHKTRNRQPLAVFNEECEAVEYAETLVDIFFSKGCTTAELSENADREYNPVRRSWNVEGKKEAHTVELWESDENGNF